jgi:NTP pyrophosphatase (non-canonical NTP hydrolase)
MDIVELIEDWRNKFSLPVRKTPQLVNLDEQNLCLSLIDEELNELRDAFKSNNLVEVADACGDLLFVVMQAINVSGLDANKLISIIYESNMSKSCKTEEEAIATQEKYMKEKGVETFIDFKELFFVKRKTDGKLLKSINFKEPQWKEKYPELL